MCVNGRRSAVRTLPPVRNDRTVVRLARIGI